MCKAFEQILVDHCAPTLAGHKCGSLFNLRGLSQEACGRCVQEANQLLQAKGVALRVLKACDACCLVYVYRPAQLQAKLLQPEVQAFLHQYRYEGTALDGMLRRLSRRIVACTDFPHEIGIFLDYPLADVRGFMLHHGANYTCSGCWKAYGNPQEAQQRFTLYRKCKSVYRDCYQRGFGVLRLTVAA